MGTRPRVTACRDLTLNIEGTKLERVPNYKYLGLTLDQHLTYEAHLSALNNTARHKVYLLRLVRPNLTEFAALQVYKQMILPLIEYGNTLYASAAVKQLNKVQVAQNSALKAVFGLPRLTPTVVLHDKAKLNMLDKRRERAVLLQVHKRAKVRDYLDFKDRGTRRHTNRLKVSPKKNH